MFGLIIKLSVNKLGCGSMDFYQNISHLTITQTDSLSEDSLIRLDVKGLRTPIHVHLHKQVVLGRYDPSNRIQPEVDLSKVAGYRFGVSRRHAVLQQNKQGFIELIDLGSSNGTFLNGRRLTPNISARVHHGDIIRLGKIDISLWYPEAS